MSTKKKVSDLDALFAEKETVVVQEKKVYETAQ
jgi:hypothetical protein